MDTWTADDGDKRGSAAWRVNTPCVMHGQHGKGHCSCRSDYRHRNPLCAGDADRCADELPTGGSPWLGELAMRYCEQQHCRCPHRTDHQPCIIGREVVPAYPGRSENSAKGACCCYPTLGMAQRMRFKTYPTSNRILLQIDSPAPNAGFCPLRNKEHLISEDGALRTIVNICLYPVGVAHLGLAIHDKEIR